MKTEADSKRRSDIRKEAGVTADGRQKAEYANRNVFAIDTKTNIQTIFQIERSRSAGYGPAMEELYCPSRIDPMPEAVTTETVFDDDDDDFDFDPDDGDLRSIARDLGHL